MFFLVDPHLFFYLLWDDMIHKTPDEVVIFRPSIVDMVVTSMECCVRNGFFFSFFSPKVFGFFSFEKGTIDPQLVLKLEQKG